MYDVVLCTSPTRSVAILSSADFTANIRCDTIRVCLGTRSTAPVKWVLNHRGCEIVLPVDCFSVPVQKIKRCEETMWMVHLDCEFSLTSIPYPFRNYFYCWCPWFGTGRTRQLLSELVRMHTWAAMAWPCFIQMHAGIVSNFNAMHHAAASAVCRSASILYHLPFEWSAQNCFSWQLRYFAWMSHVMWHEDPIFSFRTLDGVDTWWTVISKCSWTKVHPYKLPKLAYCLFSISLCFLSCLSIPEHFGLLCGLLGFMQLHDDHHCRLNFLMTGDF